jgi:hypothetical protein
MADANGPAQPVYLQKLYALRAMILPKRGNVVGEIAAADLFDLLVIFSPPGKRWRAECRE